MKRVLSFCFIISFVCAAQQAWAYTLFRDDFNSSQLSGSWTVKNNNQSYYSFTGTTLDLRANSGDLYTNLNNYKNLFLINNPASSNFIMTVRFNKFDPININWAQFALLAYDSDDDYVKSTYAYSYSNGRYIILASETSGWYPADASVVPMNFGVNPFYISLKKVDNLYTQYYSADGINFISTGSMFYGDGTPLKLGFVAMSDPTESSHAYIDWFEVTDLAGSTPVPEPLTIFSLAFGLILSIFAKKKR